MGAQACEFSENSDDMILDNGRVQDPLWRHQMEIFSALLALCAGNVPVIGEFPTQRPVTRSFDVFFDRRLNNGWVNNGKAGDLSRHRAHYDVTVMQDYCVEREHCCEDCYLFGRFWSNA